MSEPYQIASLKPTGLAPELAVRACHEALCTAGLRLDEYAVLLLNDDIGAAPEVESVEDETEALDRLITWPTLGSLDYAGPEGSVTVSFYNRERFSGVNAVVVSALQRAVERADAVLSHPLIL